MGVQLGKKMRKLRRSQSGGAGIRPRVRRSSWEKATPPINLWCIVSGPCDATETLVLHYAYSVAHHETAARKTPPEAPRKVGK